MEDYDDANAVDDSAADAVALAGANDGADGVGS